MPKHDHNETSAQHPQLAVGAVVFKNGQVLLVRRAHPPGMDLWAIPGGKVELGESLQAAAEREILEETGITIRAGEPLYGFDGIDRDANNCIRFHYVIVDLSADYVRGKIQPGDDAVEARWIGPGELEDLKISSETVTLLRTRFGFGDKLQSNSALRKKPTRKIK
jgi:ADP-ribose pyrophosphatase